ncbi:hypothetical protein LZ554_006723 [Drepanopeziza brunnea f. sp. 'monogermtubi']|nr:hypothetical protein LZ554_006723 [Drepanopeziza brunnea f. sp. 'monogermtubi']
MSGPSETCQIVNTTKTGAEWSEEEIAFNNQPEALSFLLQPIEEELNGGLNRNRYGIVVDFNKHKRAAAAAQRNQDAIKQDNITKQDNTATDLKANAPASDHISRPILDNGSNNKFTGQEIAGSDAGKFKGLAGSRYSTNDNGGPPSPSRRPQPSSIIRATAPAFNNVSRPTFKFTGQEIAGSDAGKFKGLAGSRYGTNDNGGSPSRHPQRARAPKANAPAASVHISRPIFDDGSTTKFTGQGIAGSDVGKFRGLAGSRYA